MWVGQSVHEQHLNAHHFSQALEARGDGHSPGCWRQSAKGKPATGNTVTIHQELYHIINCLRSQPVTLFNIKVTLKEEVEKSSILDLHILAKSHRIQPL